MEVEVIAAIIGATVGVAGIIAAAIQAYLAYLERKRSALDEYIFRALDRFEGGRQERNIGISVIGHYWDQAPHLEGSFVRLLTNQGIFIVAEGKPDKAHELNNMERIVRLLESVPKSKSEYDQFFDDLLQELKSRRTKPPGTRLTHEVLDDWVDRLTKRSPVGSPAPW